MTTQQKDKENCLTDGTNLLSTGKSNDLFMKTDIFDSSQIAFAHKVEYVHYSSARRDRPYDDNNKSHEDLIDFGKVEPIQNKTRYNNSYNSEVDNANDDN